MGEQLSPSRKRITMKLLLVLYSLPLPTLSPRANPRPKLILRPCGTDTMGTPIRMGTDSDTEDGVDTTVDTTATTHIHTVIDIGDVRSARPRAKPNPRPRPILHFSIPMLTLMPTVATMVDILTPMDTLDTMDTMLP